MLWSDGSRALVADYKSNVLDGAEPAAVVEDEYGLQRLVYALACLRSGVDEVEVVYQFLERPDDVVSRTFAQADVPGLEAELSEAIARIRAGEFRPDAERLRLLGAVRRSISSAGPSSSRGRLILDGRPVMAVDRHPRGEERRSTI